MTRPALQQMARWLTRRERHDWSWAELSERSGHPVWRLRYWQRRLEGTHDPRPRPRRGGAFVAVELAEPVSAGTSPGGAIEITTPSGYRVTVAREFDAEHLRQVVQVLERGC